MSSSSPNFLKASGALSAADIARMCGGCLVAGTADEVVISALSSAAEPQAGSLVFVQPKTKGLDVSRLSVAGAILCVEADLDAMPEGPARIVVDAPQRAFAQVGRHLFPDSIGPGSVSMTGGASEDYAGARVSRLAKIEDGVVIGAGAVVGDYAAIGRGTVVGVNAVVGNHCQIGRDCRIGPAAVLQFALVGNEVIIHGGAQIGQDGFGFVPGPAGLEKVPQLGRVIIQDRVEIGANSTVDRGALGDTVIGEGTKIDNLVQIAHNVRIGRHCVFASQTGISGSVVIGDGCMFGGRVGVADHVTIGSGVQLAAASGIISDVPDGARLMGTPAVPIKQFFRQVATLRKLSAVDKKPKNSD